jgi:exo-beta-1,3-glucanase (GH17 family)
MKQALNIILALTLHVMVVHAQINWRSGAGGVEWAVACDFVNHDMGSAQVPGDQCGGKCMSTSGCTHFSWTPGNPGTCWMKSGSIQKSDAKFNNNDKMICGITPSSNPVTKLNCVNYEPFSDPNYPNNVPQALKNTLSLVAAQGFKCIKTFYSQYYGNSIVKFAQQYNLKVVLGIRMSESFTEAEIKTAISDCLSSSNIIAIYTGNENLPNGQFSSEIISIKNRVKSAGCNVPFGTAQTIGYYLGAPDQNLLNQMDWLGYNVYPFFSNLGSGTSRDSLRAQIGQLKNRYSSSFQKFFITETGWPSAGGNSPQNNPSTLAKAKEYADYVASMFCSGEIDTKWFSYFVFNDPTYKKNVPSFENNFGLVNPAGQPKWNIGNLHC